jgi:hypothetical protein
VKAAWRYFDTPLKLKSGIVLPTEPDEYGMRIVQKRESKNARIRELVDEHEAK